MAVWERPLGTTLAETVRETLASRFGELRLTAALDDVERAFVEPLAVSGLCLASAMGLASDIARVGRHFADVMGHDRLDIRLERVRGNACQKFHADYVTAGLITTYSGRATEWLDQHDSAQLDRGASPADLSIRSLRESDVALLKERLWAEDVAIIHRSPPIAGTGDQRLLLVINPDGKSRGDC